MNALQIADLINKLDQFVIDHVTAPEVKAAVMFADIRTYMFNTMNDVIREEQT